MRIQPVGTKIIVLPLESKSTTTAGGIELVETELSRATVIEVGDAVDSLYKKGDTVLFPEKRGTTLSYHGKVHLWLDGLSTSLGGDIWGIEIKGEK